MDNNKNQSNEIKKEEKLKGYEYFEYDVDMEASEELLLHDEFIPNLNHWTTSNEQKVKADEIEKITDGQK